MSKINLDIKDAHNRKEKNKKEREKEKIDRAKATRGLR
jgi:hypothetical protein